MVLSDSSIAIHDVEAALSALLGRNQLLSLAVCIKDEPSCSTVFYSFDDLMNLYFVSERSTHHASVIGAGCNVALCIYKPTDQWGPGDLQGLQAVGKAFRAEGDELALGWKSYSSRYPDIGKYYDGPADLDGEHSESCLYLIEVGRMKLLFERIFGLERYVEIGFEK